MKRSKNNKPTIERQNLNAILKDLMDPLVSATKEAKEILSDDAENEILELRKQLLAVKAEDLSEMEKSFLRKVGRYQAKAKLRKVTKEIYEIYSKKKVAQKRN